MGKFVPDMSTTKGPVTYCLDAMSIRADARPKLENLRQAILALHRQGFVGLETAFAQSLFPDFFEGGKIAAITDHLREKWFSLDGWWPSFQPVAPIYAYGLLRTINASLEAKGAPTPIDAHWILGHTAVEMINLVGPRQVTLLVATPAPPEPASGRIEDVASEAWISARRAGRTANEISPIDESGITLGNDLRVRTFRVPGRAPKSP